MASARVTLGFICVVADISSNMVQLAFPQKERTDINRTIFYGVLLTKSLFGVICVVSGCQTSSQDFWQQQDADICTGVGRSCRYDFAIHGKQLRQD